MASILRRAVLERQARHAKQVRHVRSLRSLTRLDAMEVAGEQQGVLESRRQRVLEVLRHATLRSLERFAEAWNAVEWTALENPRERILG